MIPQELRQFAATNRGGSGGFRSSHFRGGGRYGRGRGRFGGGRGGYASYSGSNAFPVGSSGGPPSYIYYGMTVYIFDSSDNNNLKSIYVFIYEDK